MPSPPTSPSPSPDALTAEIAHLEALLAKARSQLPAPRSLPLNPVPINTTLTHTLLLLSDSALPLGSFAFSAGLESHLAHLRLSPPSPFPSRPHTTNPLPLLLPYPQHNQQPATPLPHFLSLSLHSLSTTSLPHLLTAHASPPRLRALDAALDASTLCPVARRASLAQGRALLTVWERAFRRNAGSAGSAGACEEEEEEAAKRALAEFVQGLKPPPPSSTTADTTADPPTPRSSWLPALQSPSGHFAPVWGTVTRAMGIGSRHDAAYAFLFGHAKAVVSAGVRAGVLGPYQAQALLASGWVRGEIERVLVLGDGMGMGMGMGMMDGVEGAGQGVPVMDLWVGRHEVLYSRIFNS